MASRSSRRPFVALNPSTADGQFDDPTVRRCVGFAKSWGFGKIVIANLFALRSSHPSLLSRDDDPIGPQNDWWLSELSVRFNFTIAAWGVHGSLKERAARVMPKLVNVHHLGLTTAGHPRHPLYLPKSARPVQFPVGALPA